METIVKEQNTEVKKSGIKFKLTSLLSFAIISKPGKYLLKVFNNVSDANLIPATETANAHHIVTLRAVPADKFAQLKELFRDGKTEVDIEDTNGLFMTANRWEGEALPMKGEAIECVVDYVDNKDKTEKVLKIAQSRVVAAKAADTIDMSFFVPESSGAQAGQGQSNDLVTGKK